MLGEWVKNSLYCVAMLSAITGCIASATKEAEKEDEIIQETPANLGDDGWVLTYNDDFDVLDLGHYETHYIWSREQIINNELQYYIEPFAFGMSPFSTENGVLKIQASKKNNELDWLTDQEYISGVLTTRGNFSQKYGRFEIRARMPKGKGLWPAFWMLPTHDEWPSGIDILPELDVMEYLGHEGETYHTTLHSNETGESRPDGHTNNTASMLFEDFHVYTAVWTKTKVAWYFDHQKVYETDAPEDFDTPKHMLLNLAVGGAWAGTPDLETEFPAHFEIDYLRSYQFKKPEDLSEGPSGSTIDSPDESGLDRLEPPLNFHGIVYSGNFAELFWEKRDEHTEDTSFDLIRDGNVIASQNTTSYFETGLIPGATYHYEVVAKKAGFRSSFPATVSLTTTGERPVEAPTPEPPTGLTGVVNGTRSIELHWIPSSSNNVDHYELWRGGVLVFVSSDLSFMDYDIERNSTYAYQVFAVDGDGDGSAGSNIWSGRVE